MEKPSTSTSISMKFTGNGSDAGGVLLRETDLRLGLMIRLARCFRDYRKPGSVEHPVRSLAAKRVYALRIIRQAVEAELESFLEEHTDTRDA